MSNQALQVQEVARLQAVQASPTASLAQVAQLLERSQQGFIPISTNGRVQGIITPWDLSRATALGLGPNTTPAHAIMQRNPATISASASLEEAARVMEQEQTRSLCVCNGEGQCIGTLTLNQLSQAAPESAARVLQATAYELAAIEASPVQFAVQQTARVGMAHSKAA